MFPLSLLLVNLPGFPWDLELIPPLFCCWIHHGFFVNLRWHPHESIRISVIFRVQTFALLWVSQDFGNILMWHILFFFKRIHLGYCVYACTKVPLDLKQVTLCPPSITGLPLDLEILIRCLTVFMSANFDPAFWKCEGAQAKIVVYYPRNEVKILW